MKCPFCHTRLPAQVYQTYTTFVCENESCEFHGMPRFQTVYNNYPTYLLSKTYILDTYYLQVDYVNETTRVSLLDVVILLDPVIVPCIIKPDLRDVAKAAAKLRKLMVFS